MLRSIFSTVVALVTIFVLTFLMVLQGPKLLSTWLSALPQHRQERVRHVAADCAKAVTGYMTGNLLISVIAGAVTYVVLWITGVPYRGVVALFVGFADLIPLVGATLGAVVAIAVAALHSLPAAIVVLVVFVVYQQLENHVLQPVIMSRTVELSALTVLVSILIGVELFGFLGALLAIPVAGVLHVIGRDVYDSYHGRLKAEPTTRRRRAPGVAAPTPGTRRAAAPRRHRQLTPPTRSRSDSNSAANETSLVRRRTLNWPSVRWPCSTMRRRYRSNSPGRTTRMTGAP